MKVNYSQIVETARSYYNSDDADNFYFHVWGGTDIHIGLYEIPGESIAVAPNPDSDAVVLSTQHDEEIGYGALKEAVS